MNTRKKGFSLIEVVVAIAVASVIGYFVIGFSISLLDVWRTNQQSVGTEVDASIVLDMISADLQNAAAHDAFGSGTVFAATAMDRGLAENPDRGWKGKDSLRPTEGQFDPNRHLYGWGGMWLRFFSAAPTLNAVAYQIVRREATGDTAAPTIYGLYRSVVRQDFTDAAGFDLDATIYSEPGSSNPDSAFDGHAKTIVKPGSFDLLAENVVDFGVRLYRYKNDALATPVSSPGMEIVFPMYAGLVDGAPSWASTTEFKAMSRQQYPDVAEIVIRILDAEGARLLEQAEANQETGAYEAIIAEHGHIFRRLIEVRLGGEE